MLFPLLQFIFDVGNNWYNEVVPEPCCWLNMDRCFFKVCFQRRVAVRPAGNHELMRSVLGCGSGEKFVKFTGYHYGFDGTKEIGCNFLDVMIPRTLAGIEAIWQINERV